VVVSMIFVFAIIGSVIVQDQSPKANLYYEIHKRTNKDLKGVDSLRSGFPLLPRFFYGFRADSTLYLSDLDLTDFDFNNLRGLQEEFIVDLSCSNVTDSQLKIICQFKNIVWLLFRYNHDISDDGFREIANLKNLRALDLCRTNCTDDSVRLFKDLPNLKILVLQHSSHINGFAFCTNDGWQALVRLNLVGCTISDKVFDFLPNMPNLRSLFFSVKDDNRLPQNIENLLNCKSLKYVYIYGKNLKSHHEEGLLDDLICKFTESGIEVQIRCLQTLPPTLPSLELRY
jgi:hypothetical protein